MGATASTKGTGPYEGVIRVGKKVVWCCGHSHRNRRNSTYTSGKSALDCASAHLKYATADQEQIKSLESWYHKIPASPFEAEQLARGYEFFKYCLTRRDEVKTAITNPRTQPCAPQQKN